MHPNRTFVRSRFLPGSPLQRYLERKRPSSAVVNNDTTTFHDVLTLLKNIIVEEGLFDERNPSIILVDSQLEQVVNARALHLAELTGPVQTQLRVSDTPVERVPQLPDTYRSCLGPFPQPEGRGRPVPLNSQVRVKPTIYRIIAEQRGREPGPLETFTCREIANYLSAYILRKKYHLIDDRNIKVVICEGDALGEAFNVKAFHRSQVLDLLFGQIIPCGNSSAPG